MSPGSEEADGKDPEANTTIDRHHRRHGQPAPIPHQSLDTSDHGRDPQALLGATTPLLGIPNRTRPCSVKGAEDILLLPVGTILHRPISLILTNKILTTASSITHLNNIEDTTGTTMRLWIGAMAMATELKRTTPEDGTRRPLRLPPTTGPGPIAGSLDILIKGTPLSIPETLLSVRTRLSVPSLLQTRSLGKFTVHLLHHSRHSHHNRLNRSRPRRAKTGRRSIQQRSLRSFLTWRRAKAPSGPPRRLSLARKSPGPNQSTKSSKYR